ncbi:hypothetical protein ASPACDRAFT_58823 [Aspergillus aculeatus ATCC 16872]|uniref:Protein kinase domain-containing protein n=1 Tax=Aspergillus aculeatus (strain ATCC 16872 / CBS 172.66 / WB 5094) TaxID=690307 RepID=A0A1L9X204_ASPA1|nr:uncharacterized protein ASPACDRAFT_58823 [Aspergillus aculeatus ATCC 16872]OJK02515.1 hypothetical protein ASPACDRAFT_58823 [Aspergillus aculeatus ATCC 16872]
MAVKPDSSVSPDEPLKHEKSSDDHPDDEGSDDEGSDDEGSEYESSDDERELVILELPKVNGADYADEEIEAELTRVWHWKSANYAIRRPRMFIPVPKPEIISDLDYTMLYHNYVESEGNTFSFLRRLLPELCQPFFKAYGDWTGDDLESHLLRAEVHLQLVTTKDGLPRLINLTLPGHLPALMVRQGPGYDNTPWLDLDIPAGFPRYELAAARFLETMAPNWVYKVEINGTPLIYKRREMAEELEGCSLRAPKLAAFIGLESQCPGILVSFIPHETTLWDVRDNMQTTDLAVRHKWFDQIHETVMALHQRGMTWGDVKPDNVLIDSNQDAWIIDLEGGFTKGYVPLELKGTVAGDLVGLKAIREFLCLPD